MKKGNIVVVVLLSALAFVLIAIIGLVGLLMVSSSGQGEGDVKQPSHIESSLKEEDDSLKDLTISGNLGKLAEGLNVNKGYIGDIPVLEYFDANLGIEGKPVVLLLHGLDSNKEVFEGMATVLAQTGFLVVVPDLYLHGERTAKSDMTPVHIAVKSSGEMDLILKYYEGTKLADISRVGILGFSMGGMTAYHYVANGQYPVKALATVCSTANWEELKSGTTIYNRYSRGRLIGLSQKVYEEVNQYVDANTPYAGVLEKTDVAYGIIIGGKDPIIPCEGTVKMCEDLQAKGADVLVEYKQDKGHDVTEEDLVTMLYFLNEKLNAN